jgi:aryl-alcohol dehydrogenase-like predicted oxidoreductase
MKYTVFADSGLKVSKLCLGTALFGSSLPREAAFEQMDYFYEHGGNFLDSARVYADWLPKGHGASETTVGDWLRDRRLRNKVVISTKGAHPLLGSMDIPRMGKAEVREDLEESLRCLGMDRIDLYFLHRDDTGHPVEEILAMLEEFKKAGKIAHYGCSNWKLSRQEEADKAASRNGWEGFICSQLRWGLGDLTLSSITDKSLVPMDREILSYHRATGKVAMAFTSSCNGYFTKKLRGLPVTAGQEAAYGNKTNAALLEKIALWEKESGWPSAALALAYVMSEDFPAVPISSFSSIKQLEEALPAGDFEFPKDHLEQIAAIKQFVV